MIESQKNYETFEKIILLKGCAGLGNRLFTLFSALRYAEKTNRKLIVDWSDGLYGKKGTNVFPIYFQLTHPLYSTEIPQSIYTLSENNVYPKCLHGFLGETVSDKFFQATHPFFTRLKNSKNTFLHLNKLKTHWAPASARKLIKTKTGYLKSVFSNQSFPMGENLPYNLTETLVVFVDYTPLFLPEFIRYLKPSPQLSEEITNFITTHGLTEYIGVHVRNTDMKPTRKIEELIEEIKLHEKNAGIFLATDDPEVSKLFKRSFEKVVEYPKFIPENSSGGLHKWALKEKKSELAEQIFKESIMDMYLLSSTKKILFQGNSSFSKMAVSLNQNPHACRNWLVPL